jgi:predicted transcriptional regulator
LLYLVGRVCNALSVSEMSKILLISVKPEFAEKILSGTKTIELRKSSPNVAVGDLIIIYSTLPEKAIVGTCVVKAIIKKSPLQLWRSFSDKMGIDRKRYFDYFKDCEAAVGIVLTGIDRLDKKVSLDSVRKVIPRFTPPQTFRYLNRSQVATVGLGLFKSA